MIMTAMGCAAMWWAAQGARASVPAKPVQVVTVQATGVGFPPRHMKGARARLMAQRAAEVVAVRNLAGRLGHRSSVHGFRYVSARTNADGSVYVVVETKVRR